MRHRSLCKGIPQGLQPVACPGTHENTGYLHTFQIVDILQMGRLTLVFKGIGLVEDQYLRHMGRANLAQYPLHLGDLLREIGVGGIHHMQEQVSIYRLLQRGLKGVDQAVGQIADKTYRVRQRN